VQTVNHIILIRAIISPLTTTVDGSSENASVSSGLISCVEICSMAVRSILTGIRPMGVLDD